MIDMSQVPAPTVIEQIDFEALFAQIKADIIAEHPSVADTLELESEPITKLAQVFAYRIMHVQQQANNYALSLCLAHGHGAQLDNLGALPWINTPRKLISDATQTTDAIYESDDEYKVRLQMALEGFTTAGSIGAYIYHALSAHSLVKDVKVDCPRFVDVSANQDQIILQCTHDAGLENPMPGDVAVTVLTRENKGEASNEVLLAVANALNKDKVRPLNDVVRERSVEVVEYVLNARLVLYPNADAALALQLANDALEQMFDEFHRIGYDITLSEITKRLKVQGVQDVLIDSPSANIVINERQVAFCIEHNISIGGENV